MLVFAFFWTTQETLKSGRMLAPSSTESVLEANNLTAPTPRFLPPLNSLMHACASHNWAILLHDCPSSSCLVDAQNILLHAIAARASISRHPLCSPPCAGTKPSASFQASSEIPPQLSMVTPIRCIHVHATAACASGFIRSVHAPP